MWLELLMQTTTFMEVTHNNGSNAHNTHLKRHGIKVIYWAGQWSVIVFETEYIPQQVRWQT